VVDSGVGVEEGESSMKSTREEGDMEVVGGGGGEQLRIEVKEVAGEGDLLLHVDRLAGGGGFGDLKGK
jgi:hypothetical protein